MLRYLALASFAVSLGWLFVDAPIVVFREAWFVLVMMALTIATRSISWTVAATALSFGIGVAAPAMVAIGWLLMRAGIDVSAGGPVGWGLVPLVEEVLKLAVVCLTGWLYRRRSRLSFNPSDWLLAGCAVGAGFAMVENAQLVAHDPSVLRDMARQYGPSFLVPGAWGIVGYVGHGGATGLVAAGVGAWLALRRAPSGAAASIGWAALVAPFAWIVLEHALANLRVDTGSDAALLFGNGRLTPWLFLAAVGAVIYRDWRMAAKAVARSRIFQRRRAALREALIGTHVPKHRTLWRRWLVAASEQRLVNAAAWATLEQLSAERTSR